ncbi:MAG: ADP/ATP-dependent (S)-NAD(P)H-hydrate dehydratase [Nocardioidaceae bacterium]
MAAGSEHYTGAGLLVTAAAVATGLAGMIRYDGASAALVRSAHPEVVIGGGRVQAWAVGSGIGDRSAELVGRILGEELPTVIDADGLRYIPVPCPAEAVLTPHAGELARMLEVPRERVEAGMLEAATAAARRWDAVVLLKGPRSLIAAPDGRVRVNTTGVEWLGTAGAGDVLTGVVGVLLAAGLSGFDAASVGAWVHGQAARLASHGGPISASDVVRAVPEAIRSLVG